ncbi:MAG: hypothetical protein II653_00925 [Lachnospiraceae bacterium]|nr:hypothetical protein [Lachnospiraceae bacterium]
MIRYILIIIMMAIVVSFTGCGNVSGVSNRIHVDSSGVNDVMQQEMAKEDKKTQTSTDTNNETEAESETDADNQATTELSENADYASKEVDLKSIDLDLTTYSSTMVYTEVYNMMLQPKEYKGKTVKIKGLFTTYCEESTGVNYFACIVQDATACCSQGIEFSLTGDYTYPDDYPKEGEEITVVGVFDTYKEVNSEYIVLKNAMII